MGELTRTLGDGIRALRRWWSGLSGDEAATWAVLGSATAIVIYLLLAVVLGLAGVSTTWMPVSLVCVSAFLWLLAATRFIHRSDDYGKEPHDNEHRDRD